MLDIIEANFKSYQQILDNRVNKQVAEKCDQQTQLTSILAISASCDLILDFKSC